MARTLHEFKCKKCGIIFHRSYKKSQFCSHSCGNSVKKGTTNANRKYFSTECPSCKKQFVPRNSTHRYCSGHCGRVGKPSWNKGKEYLAIRGEKHPNWKGGISRIHHTERQLAMMTIGYELWRSDVFERDNYTCQMCGAKGCYIEAHHIKAWSKYPELRYEVCNGSTLCKKCHNKLRRKNI